MHQGDSAYASGQLEAAFESWEQAHEASVHEDDFVGAAAAAVWIALHLTMDTGLLSPVRTWIKRAERLLDGAGPTPVDAALGLAHAFERLYSGDFAEARSWADKAIEAGHEHGQPSPAAMARVAKARCYIFEGDVESGLKLLEEAATAASSGDVDDLTLGMTYCEIVCAWHGLAMYDLAEEWTHAMERFSHRHAIGSVGGRCAIHRAQIMRLRGNCVGAETEALAACEALRPYMRREFGWPLTELGSIRLRLGDLEGAEKAFLGAYERGWEPQPGLALLRLAQGDVTAASSLIRDALERPLNLLSKELPPNNELRRAPLLEAQVEIAIAESDLPRARAASDELGTIAKRFRSKALEAAASLSLGRLRLAEGDAPEATTAFRAAVHIWSEISAPYEVALARLGLGEAYRAQGFEEGARLELRAAELSFERVGAKVEAIHVAAVTHEDDLTPTAAPDDSRFRREGDYWEIAFDGVSVRVRDMKGLHYLAHLLSQPGREHHVVDLMASGRMGGERSEAPLDDGLSYSTGGDAGELLDDRAKNAYRRRLADIDEDIEEAEEFGDTERAARARLEREFLVRELSRAVGLSGRDRRAGAASERARAAVTRAIRNALKKISEHHPSIGEHLERSIRTGTYCSYSPDPRAAIHWVL